MEAADSGLYSAVEEADWSSLEEACELQKSGSGGGECRSKGRCSD